MFRDRPVSCAGSTISTPGCLSANCMSRRQRSKCPCLASCTASRRMSRVSSITSARNKASTLPARREARRDEHEEDQSDLPTQGHRSVEYERTGQYSWRSWIRFWMPKKRLAEMKTEAEEARWFEDKQDRLLKLFEQAGKEGALRVGGKIVGLTLSTQTGTVARPPWQKVMLRIPTGDIDRARRLAADKGIGYQTYIKMLLRAGLDRDEKLPRRA